MSNLNLQQIIPISNPSNFTFDAEKIVIANDRGELVYTALPNLHFIEDFADDTDFTYTAAEVEFAAGKAQQLDVLSAEVTAYHSFAIKDFDYGEGDLTGALNSNASIAGGELTIPDSGSSFTYTVIGKLGTQELSVELNVKFPYSGSPVGTTTIFLLSDQVTVYHLATSKLIRVIVKHQTGTDTTDYPAFDPVSGQSYNFHLGIHNCIYLA